MRWAAPIYNRNNQFGGGCLDGDEGLTSLGNALVRQMNSAGMTICCSHVGERTSLEIMEASERPVIFSHSNAAALHRHPRNISDTQIRACAETGGVVGINGVGIFLGNNETRPSTVARHICYVADRVGIEHVGIGLDYAFDLAELESFFATNRDMFPEEEYGNTREIVPPERFQHLASELAESGMHAIEIDLVLGGNWQRIARQVWR
jgi:membrane dipeptidase